MQRYIYTNVRRLYYEYQIRAFIKFNIRYSYAKAGDIDIDADKIADTTAINVLSEIQDVIQNYVKREMLME